MLDHIAIYVQDIETAKRFYTATMLPLGYQLLSEFPEWSVIGLGAGGRADLWLSQREANHNAHIAFLAQDTAAVDAWYAAAIAAGGSDNGAPGYRSEYDAGYYAAFIIDPFGNNIEAVFHDPSPNAPVAA
jgi:catechol 2,3-dioxygenase-like lactoylglutathione lyase family enzyme